MDKIYTVLEFHEMTNFMSIHLVYGFVWGIVEYLFLRYSALFSIVSYTEYLMQIFIKRKK